MPKLKPQAPPLDEIERDFIDALNRLKDGKPKNKKNRAVLEKKGVVRINASTVALEAGRSRTYIGMDSCRYPRVRSLVEAAKEQKGSLPTTHTELINRLRADKVELTRRLKLYQAEVTHHFLARTAAERDAANARAELARVKKNIVDRERIRPIAPTKKGGQRSSEPPER